MSGAHGAGPIRIRAGLRGTHRASALRPSPPFLSCHNPVQAEGGRPPPDQAGPATLDRLRQKSRETAAASPSPPAGRATAAVGLEPPKETTRPPPAAASGWL